MHNLCCSCSFFLHQINVCHYDFPFPYIFLTRTSKNMFQTFHRAKLQNLHSPFEAKKKKTEKSFPSRSLPAIEIVSADKLISLYSCMASAKC